VFSTSHLRVMFVVAGLAAIAPAAATASDSTSAVARLCAQQSARSSAASARLDLRQNHAACRLFRFTVSAAQTSYSARIHRDSTSDASDSAAEVSAEETLGTQYEAEIAPAITVLDNAYAAAASALLTSVSGANAPICTGPLSTIPILSKLVCSTYSDTLGAAQAAFRAATAPANASYAKQWAAIQSRYHSQNRALATDTRRANYQLAGAMTRAVASFDRSARR
jgi:hypothetical protein